MIVNFFFESSPRGLGLWIRRFSHFTFLSIPKVISQIFRFEQFDTRTFLFVGIRKCRKWFQTGSEIGFSSSPLALESSHSGDDSHKQSWAKSVHSFSRHGYRSHRWIRSPRLPSPALCIYMKSWVQIISIVVRTVYAGKKYIALFSIFNDELIGVTFVTVIMSSSWITSCLFSAIRVDTGHMRGQKVHYMYAGSTIPHVRSPEIETESTIRYICHGWIRTSPRESCECSARAPSAVKSPKKHAPNCVRNLT